MHRAGAEIDRLAKLFTTFNQALADFSGVDLILSNMQIYAKWKVSSDSRQL